MSDTTTVREECENYIQQYANFDHLPYYARRVKEEQALLEWYNTDEVRTVYQIICPGADYDQCIYAEHEDAQLWIDGCLDACGDDCDCGKIMELQMSGRDFGNLPQWDI